MIPWRNLRRFILKGVKQPGYALRVFIKRLKANFYYSFSRGRSSYPEAITLFLTHRCNLQCRMCGQWGEGGVTKKESALFIRDELSLDKLKSIVDEVSAFRPNITLFGGEPLLYSGCSQIIKYIKQKSMHSLMITNGFLLEGLAREIVESGLDELNVSLDGDAKLHDEIRGMTGLFNQIMKGLQEVHFFKAQKRRKKPFINLQCTITKYNYRNLELLINVANEAHADSLTFHNLIFLNQQVLEQQKKYDELLGCSSSDWKGFEFEPEIDPGLLHKKIKEILSKKYSFSVDFYPNFSYSELVEYYGSSRANFSGKSGRCLSPWVTAYIFPDGTVRPCLNMNYVFGNVKNSRFSEIWNGPAAIRYRQELKKERTFPVCLRCTELYRY